MPKATDVGQDNYRPLPVFWPELAKISLGVSDEGQLAVRVQATKQLLELCPEAKAAFDEAAAKFLEHFSSAHKLKELQIRASSGAETEQAGRTIAERDGATVVDLTSQSNQC